MKRIVICYLIAAAIHMAVVGVAIKPPHAGSGVLIIGAVLFFWASPAITIVHHFQGGYDPEVFRNLTVLKAALFFLVPFGIALVVAFHRELSLWRRRASPPSNGG